MRYKNPFPVGVKLPEISVPKDTLESIGLNADSSSLEILKQLCRKGLRELKIINQENRKDYYDRVQMEIDILDDLGFVDYILLNWDIMDYCKRSGIPTGAGRGSAAGSLVLFLLGVTNIDQLSMSCFLRDSSLRVGQGKLSMRGKYSLMVLYLLILIMTFLMIAALRLLNISKISMKAKLQKYLRSIL